MAETINRGPFVALGPLIGNVLTSTGANVAAIEPYDGPGLNYQGDAIPDVRWGIFNKDSLNVGRFPGFLNSPYIVMTDQIPSAEGTATIAALANVTNGTPMTLKTTCPGGAVASTYFSTQCVAQVPLVPFQAGGGFPNQGTAVSVLALDFGFSVGTTTAGNATIASIPDTTLFYQGQWIVIGGAGNSGNTAALITQVQTVTSTNITVYPVPAGSLAAAPIGSANAYGTFPAQITATAVNPYLGVGVVGAFNPAESLSRGISITGVASGTGGAFSVFGYDIYGQAMHETITVAAGANTVYGKKAWKYIASVTPQFTDAHNYSVGTSDVFGYHLRSDKWEYTNTFWNGTFNTSNTGWLAAVRTSPATATTGDVRGTVQVSGVGGGTGYGSTVSNGSIRFSSFLSVPLFNLTTATPNNSVSMFGVTQF